MLPVSVAFCGMASKRPSDLVQAKLVAGVLTPCLLAVLLCSTARAGEREYRELRTSGLTLISAAGERQTREIALQVEMFRAAVAEAFGVPVSNSMPLRIHALSREDWERYAQPRAQVAGYFTAQPFSSDLLFDVDDRAGGAYELMFHEYMHYILRTFWVEELPAFFDEGLAEVFSTARFEDGRLRLTPRTDHIRFLREHPWLPFERLLKVRRQDAEYVDHALAPAFYAQAWASLYYVLASDPAGGRRAMAYVRDLNGGVAPLHAAERLFNQERSTVNDRIAEFFRARRVPAAEIALEEVRPLQTATMHLLDSDERALLLGELMLRMGNRHRQALELFEQVRRRRPGEVRAEVGAGWAHLQSGESERAGALFDASAERPSIPHETAVALARGLFQLTATRQVSQPLDRHQHERLLTARDLFGSALDAPATHLEAVNGYVLTRLALDQRDRSLILLAQSAYAAAPRSSELAMGLALLHELEGRKDVARGYWRDAARNSQSGPMRARILSVLEREDDAAPGKHPPEALTQSHD
jgi:tetratricopeptide (TPR) repeat protein